jgi:hypothetical protein
LPRRSHHLVCQQRISLAHELRSTRLCL